MRIMASIVAVLGFAMPLSAQTPEKPLGKTLEAHLKAAKAPVFQKGYTLPPLSRWGWSMPYDVRVELAEKWGYALEIGGYLTEECVTDIEQHPASVNGRIVALTASDPKRYPLFVITDRPLMKSPGNLPDALRDGYYVKDGKSQLIGDPKIRPDWGDKPSWRTLNPLAPDAIFEWAAQGTLAPLLRLSKHAPIAVILNGGEYGLSCLGHGQDFWEKDPAVMAAKGNRSWLAFISEQKTRQELPISDAVRKAFPDRRLYIWYHAGCLPSWRANDAWSFDAQMLKVSDYPDQSLYYGEYNTGWAGANDLLSQFTGSVAQTIPLKQPLSYNWVCGGWTKGNISDVEHYMGFLKCLYAAGQIGAVAGYFSLPEGLNGKPVGDTPPPHLQQMMALGHVHALFSHVEEFLRQGDLLPGSLRNAITPSLTAYEFAPPANGTRVFVRKHRDRDAWLIVAWAASGDARDAKITVPGLGQVTVRARPAGSVYLAIPKGLDLLDPDAMDPTARWR